MATVLVIRPEPGASSTAAKLRAVGHRVIVSPMLKTAALEWDIPAGEFDAVMFTSEAAPRLAGDGAARFTGLPTYCVGLSTHEAATAAGFSNGISGRGGVVQLATMMAADGRQHILHLAGRDRTRLPLQLVNVTACTVYAAELTGLTPEALAALDTGAIDWVLLFSTRSASAFAAACPKRKEISVAAISRDVATAAGPGWCQMIIAAASSEFAVLAAAGLTCDKEP